MSLSEVLQNVRTNISAGAYKNEEAVRLQIVTPVLGALGWDTTNPSTFHPEYSAGRGRADIALFKMGHAQAPSVMVEVKGPGVSIDDEQPVKQLLNYCYDMGTQMALLTNGVKWNVHLPGEGGEFDKTRRVASVSLDSDLERLENILNRYLSFERHKSGDAIRDAQKDYQGLSKSKEVASNLPKIWHGMLTAPLDSLVNLVVEKYEDSYGYQPEAQLVEKFLRVEPSSPPKLPVQSVVVSKTSSKKFEPMITGPVVWRVDGVQGSSANVTDAFVALFDALYEVVGDDGFEMLSQELATKSRKPIARAKQQLSRSSDPKAAVYFYAKHLECGWWLDTHMDTASKLKRIQKMKGKLAEKLGKKIRIELRPK